ncbi:MAG TPA: lipocalin-like domain-containing protein [Vicinamibacterales bacterium]|nr:lipocalin-like domain-containing protein [Vicinamibacterales bacterium]
MTRVALLGVLLVLWSTTQPVAQESTSFTPGGLVSSWTLIAVERGVSGEKPERVANPRGLLIFDAVGHAFEFVTTASRQQPETPQADPLGMFAAYSGFWGGYRTDVEHKRITFKAQGAVSLTAMGREFSRSVALDGNRLTLTSIDEPHTQGGVRWTWQRVPTIDHLSPFYRQAVGFWEHVVERRVNVSTGAVVSESKRAPSVIVYTPGGFVGVHFPTLNRKPFAAENPTADEARAALQGYLGYYGALTVYPGEVFHNILGGVSPGAGSILRRYADINKDNNELTVRLTPTGNQPVQNQTIVILRRLSGVDDMLPRTK